MRLFAAVLPPGDALAELAPEVDELRRLPGADTLRWTGREGWHLTLAFLGEIDEATSFRSCTSGCAGPPAAPTRSRCALHGGGRFDGRALWAGSRAAWRSCGCSPNARTRPPAAPASRWSEHRRYLPHLTVARSRTPWTSSRMSTGSTTFAGSPWTVGELVLVRSNLPSVGSARRAAPVRGGAPAAGGGDGGGG